MYYSIDQLGRTIFLSDTPTRIISLVPSQTELLVDLGLRDKIVGVTKFCVHPLGLMKEKTVIGGTKNFNFGRIEAIQPDLIIGNKEENYKEGIEKLAERYPVWMSDIYCLRDALEMIASIGSLTNSAGQANRIIQQLSRDFEYPAETNGSAYYLIWNNPIMLAGKNTFIDDMMRFSGFSNLASEDRYPEVSLDRLTKDPPDFLLLSSEPYPFKRNEVEFFQKMLPSTKVTIADGEMFSWYGSRMLHAAKYFKLFAEELSGSKTRL